MTLLRGKKGSLTVEAALVLPIFLCAVISVAFLVKAALVHEIIQHAISETANELSTYSYVLSIGGVDKLDEKISEGTEGKGKLFNEHLDSYLEGYNALSTFPEDVKGKLDSGISKLKDGDIKLEDINDIKGSCSDVKAKIEEAIKSGREAFSNPKEEAASMLFSIGGYAYDSSKGALLGGISKLFITKYLKTEKLADADKRLKALNIEGGFEGLDFSRSKLLEDGRNIKIIVQYKLNLALPYNIMPNVFICQQVNSRAWMEGDDFGCLDDDSKNGSDEGVLNTVWDLPKIERGRKIQKEYYKKNTPEYFKTITRFDNGIATRVSSIDTRTLTYKKAANLKSVVEDDIDKLFEFEGDSRDGMEVRKQDIWDKRLVIVVPKGKVSPEQKKALEQCIIEARVKGISMTIDEL